MIATFNTEIDYINFSNTIHQFLLRNRNGYAAIKWSEINKSDNEEIWCVYLPTDYDNYNEKLELTGIELIDTLPENWKNEELI